MTLQTRPIVFVSLYADVVVDVASYSYVDFSYDTYLLASVSPIQRKHLQCLGRHPWPRTRVALARPKPLVLAESSSRRRLRRYPEAGIYDRSLLREGGQLKANPCIYLYLARDKLAPTEDGYVAQLEQKRKV